MRSCSHQNNAFGAQSWASVHSDCTSISNFSSHMRPNFTPHWEFLLHHKSRYSPQSFFPDRLFVRKFFSWQINPSNSTPELKSLQTGTKSTPQDQLEDLSKSYFTLTPSKLPHIAALTKSYGTNPQWFYAIQSCSKRIDSFKCIEPCRSSFSLLQ